MIKLEINDGRIVTWMCIVKPEGRISEKELRTRLTFKSMREWLQDRKLQWFDNLEIMEESGWSSNCRTFEVTSSSPRGRPKKTWNKVIRSYLKETKVSKDIAKNRNAWMLFIGNHPTHANMENRHLNKYDNGLTFVPFFV